MRLRSIPSTLCTCLWLCVSLAGLAQAQAIELNELLKQGNVPGLSYAIIRNGKIAEVGAYGTRDSSVGIPVDHNTIFEAASLSKPVFAYAVLRLVDSGLLSLDTPLSNYVPDYVTGDPRSAAVTVRDVLSQSSGLPNWSSWIRPLKTYFPPGNQFSYSGEGFVWLQRVVVKITGESLEEAMGRLVFDPLEMKQTSYVWRADYEANYAAPHEGLRSRTKARPTTPVVAYTLHTTAADYARFLQAVMSGAHLKPGTAKQWLRPQIALFQRCIECLDSNAAKSDQHVAWGLGWGLSHGRARSSIGVTTAASKHL